MELDPGYGHLYFDDPPGEAFDWRRAAAGGKKLFLNVGCGPKRNDLLKINPLFRGSDWNEIRLDIDPRVKPDIVASLTSLDGVPDQSVDGVWSSHNLEHLFEHDVPTALSEFQRVLKPHGILVVTTPDLETACKWIAEGRAEVQLPGMISKTRITPMDAVFGWRLRVAQGEHYMAHKTGFTMRSLGRFIHSAGFAQVRLARGRMLDIWAVARKQGTVTKEELLRAMQP